VGGSVESVDASIVWGMIRGILVWWWMSRGGLGGGVVGKAAEVTSRVSRNMRSGAERSGIGFFSLENPLGYIIPYRMEKGPVDNI
jgi:hypothetical protein